MLSPQGFIALHLGPEQMANGIPSAMDAIVHDSRMLLRRHGADDNYNMVSIDARNAFNSCSRQEFLNSLPLRCPSLAPFMNMIYGRVTPPLVIPTCPAKSIPSLEGTQQGCPVSMLLFSLSIHPLIRRISRECNLLMNRWYADDGTIIGRISEVHRALRILQTDGPTHHFWINSSKTKAFWPIMTTSKLSDICRATGIDTTPKQGLPLLGVPVGTDEYMASHVNDKLEQSQSLLTSLAAVPDPQIRFHLHRLTASTCKMLHLFRLLPPDFASPFASQFDSMQLTAYSKFHNVQLNNDAIRQVQLPMRYGGHGLTSLKGLLYASHASSLIEAAPIRLSGPQLPSVAFYRQMASRPLLVVGRNLPASTHPPNAAPDPQDPTNLGWLDPHRLAERPERTHNILFQAHHEASARQAWDHAR